MDSNDGAMHTTELTKAVLRVPNKLIRAVAIGVAVVNVAVMFITSLAKAQSPAPASKTKQETASASATGASTKAEPLSGAELWTMNCSRCHMARNPGEFTAAQWRTIFRHMQIRANLPADQAREIQKYLEAGAGK